MIAMCFTKHIPQISYTLTNSSLSTYVSVLYYHPRVCYHTCRWEVTIQSVWRKAKPYQPGNSTIKWSVHQQRVSLWSNSSCNKGLCLSIKWELCYVGKGKEFKLTCEMLTTIRTYGFCICLFNLLYNHSNVKEIFAIAILALHSKRVSLNLI